MGNHKLKWTSDEERALLAGVEKHGPGKWKNILKDPQFAPFLTHRSNIDLKDKWRNLNVSAGQGSREKSRIKSNHAIAENSAPDSSSHQNASPNAAVDDNPPNSPQDGKNAVRYNAMIFEALSTMKDENKSDIGAIVNFVEQRHEPPLPPNLRRLLGTRLRRLVLQGKLEKIQNGYKIREETTSGSPMKMPTSKKKDVVRPRQSHGSALITSAETQVADATAYKLADAENKSFLAAEAIKEVERISKLAEDSESMLQLAEEICAQCSTGEIFILT